MCSRPFETRSSPTRSLLPSQFYIDRSHCPRPHASYLAALPSTRAISQTRGFYVAFPISSIRPLGFPIYVARVPAAPFTRSRPRHFAFHAWRAVASAKAGRSSHSLHLGDVMANEQSAVSRSQCLTLQTACVAGRRRTATLLPRSVERSPFDFAPATAGKAGKAHWRLQDWH